MNFKQIASFDNFMLANMMLGNLHQNNINCHLKDEYIVTIDPLLNPAVGGIKLLVEEGDYEVALELLKSTEADYLKEIACPHCKNPTLEAEEKINSPQSFWGKLKNQSAFGQTATYKKQYRCKTCNRIFAEIPPSF